jgi:DNA-binding phage protein
MPARPARSRLFGLAPVGIGTDHVEALSSYVVRLARAHSVSPRRLIREEFVRAGQGSRARSAARQSNDIRTMNGLDHYAETFAALVAELTAVPAVRYLTLLPLGNLLPRLGAGLLARQPRWCPECLSQMNDDGTEVYRPLVWSMNVYTRCHRHRRSLVSACPHCGRQQPFIPRFPDLFHCAHCNRSLLGGDISNGSSNGSSREEWVASWLAELVTLLPALDGIALREQFVTLLKLTIDLRTNGNRAELARRLGMPRPTLYNWLIRQGHPRLPQLLAVAYGLQFRPAALFDTEATPPGQIISPPASMNPPSSRPRLTQVQRNDLSKAITAIAGDATDVRSLKEVGRALGYTRWALKYWFPDQCEIICAKSSAARTQGARAHDAARHRAVVKVVEEMVRQGDYPGRKRVSRLLPRGALITSPNMVDAYHNAVRQCMGLLPG